MTSSALPATLQRLRARRRKRGVALLIALGVVIVYAILASHYVYVCTTYSQIANNQRDERVAYWIARGGLFRAKAQLKLDSQFQYDSLNEDWSPDITFEDGDYPQGITQPIVKTRDEEGKFNILLLAMENTTEDNQKRIQETFARLVNILQRKDERLELGEDGVSPRNVRTKDDQTPAQIIDGIREYLKKREVDDSADTTFDASRTKGSKVIRKQSPFTLLTISELLQSSTLTPEILYGVDSTEAIRKREQRWVSPEEEEKLRTELPTYDPISGEELGTRDARRQAADASRVDADYDRSISEQKLPLADFITLWGDGRININTAPREVILAMSEHLTWQMVEDLLRARDEAYDRKRTVDEENEADPGSNTDEAEEEQDNRSFRTADVAGVVAFYNRIFQNLRDESGNTGEAVQTAEQVPEEWRKAFADMQPFLSVRSRHFRVTSEARVDRIRKKFTAVFRRDRATSTTTTPTPNTNNNNTSPATNTTGGGGETGDFPPEPAVRLVMIFLDEEE